ncbi:hypothetical protein ACFRQM_42250 [Streptomyces sp. NPDC056831]|uniref:hypothetical protein n=1 Tax=Streptomyces sp. NPDC056831 TaxID=3345954 RepID=UPI0036A17C00
MLAHTDSTAPEPEGRGLQPPAYGVPSPALLARAGRGFARFLAQRTEDQDDGPDGGGEDRCFPGPPARAPESRALR